jgi:hypothetical protein
MAVQKADYIWRDYETDGVSSSGFHKPILREQRVWGTMVENAINAGLSNGGLVYDTKANMDADLAHDANASAWVIGDPTVANNGIYQKQGASGSGSWTRLQDLPYSFIRASNAGAGSANAIQATTSIPIPSGDLAAKINLNITASNTGPATVAFNGGAALPIKTNSGADVQADYLVDGGFVEGFVVDGTFRLTTDVGTASDRAAAEAAADAAVAAAASIDYITVADRTALRAVDTGAHSTVCFDGYDWQQVAYSGVSALVTADTAEGVYVRSTQDDTKVWVRIHNGELRPEMFGATAITDWDMPEDSTAALAGLASLLNALPMKVILNGLYRSTEALALTAFTLNIEGLKAEDSGFLFDDCDGIQLTHTRRDGFGLKNFTFLTNANNTRTGFSYTGGAVTADAPYRRIDACAWMGLDRYLRNRFGIAAASYTNGWLTEIDLDEGDTTFINDPVIIGPEEDRLSGFDEAAIGINFVDSSNVVVRFPQIYFKKTGIRGRGTAENLEVRGGTLVANFDGIDVETDTLGNDHNIVGVHISSINSDINLGVGGTVTTTMHNIEGCLLFCRNSNDPVSDGFTYIKAKSTVQIQNNFFFTSSGIDPVGDNHVSIDLQGGNKSIVSGNIFYTQNKLVKIASGVSGTLITDNTTVDSGSTIAVTPVDDAGASTRYGQNYGDRYSLWPVATPYGMSVGAGGLFPQTNGGCNLGKNAQRFGVGFFSGAVYPGGSNFIQSGSGSPEGVLTAPIGSMWLRTDGGAGTTLYVKESGAGNTGWVAK